MNRAPTPLSRLLRAHSIGAVAGLLTLTACPPHQNGAALSSQFARLDEGTNSPAMAGAAAPLSPEDVQRVADATPDNGASAQPGTAAEDGRFARYIALGDSFASGVGASNVQKLPCGQSDNAWPPLVYNALGISSPLIFAACSGATTQDVAAVGKLQTGGYTTGSQISQLPPADELDSALITITIGGNDIKLDDGVAKCMSSASSSSSSWSLSCLDIAQTLDTASAVVSDSLAPSLDYTFRALRSAAPNATIVAVGYPHLVDASSACDSTLVGKLINGANRQKMNDLADAINLQIKNAAENAGILSITDKVVAAFAGHEACSPDEWIVSGRNILADKNSGIAHPNDQGQQVYAQTVLAGLPAAPTRIAAADPMQAAAPASAAPMASSAPAARAAPAAPASAAPMASSAPAAKAATPGQLAPSQPGIGKPAQVSGGAGSKAAALGSAGSKADALGSAGSNADALGSAGSKADALGSAGSKADGLGSAGSNADTLGSAGSNADALGSAGSNAEALGSAGSNAEEGGYGGSLAVTDGYASSPAEEGGYGGSLTDPLGSAGSNALEDGSAGAPTEPPPDDGSGAEPPPPPDDSWWSQPAAWPAPADDGFGD